MIDLPRPHILQRLPSELRIRIYKDLLRRPSSSASEPVTKCIVKRHPPAQLPYNVDCDRYLRASDLTILLVSQQICQEALSIFYSTTHFYFPTFIDLYYYLLRIGPFRRRRIAYLSLTCCGPEAAPAFTLLRECECLKDIRLVFVDGSVPAKEELVRMRALQNVELEIVPCPYPKGARYCYCESGLAEEMEGVREAMMRPRVVGS